MPLNFNKNLFDKFQYKKYQHQGIDKALKCPYLCIVFDRDQYNEHIFETNNRTHENNYFFYFYFWLIYTSLYCSTIILLLLFST